jgi:hypothetical protein
MDIRNADNSLPPEKVKDSRVKQYFQAGALEKSSHGAVKLSRR